jgi:MSHA pilin protein MshA
VSSPNILFPGFLKVLVYFSSRVYHMHVCNKNINVIFQGVIYMKKHNGFTLIELVIVIVILGILAAFAIPKYMQLDQKARAATVMGLAGSLKSAAILVHSVAKVAKSVNDVPITNSVNIGDVNVEINSTSLYPTGMAIGISAALEDITGFVVGVAGTATAVTFNKLGATDEAACYATYNIAGGVSNVSYDTSGC